MTHVVVGYPSLEGTVELVKTMAGYKSAPGFADYIELQIPFSDPLADGPTIMHACEASLKNGTTVIDAFTVMTRLSKEVSVPLFFMAYYNTVYNYGVEKFICDAKQAGCKGLIVPDIPLEEEQNEHFYALCRKYNVPVIFVVSPITPDDRLQKISQEALLVSSGGNSFVYATARQGITGVQDSGLKISSFAKASEDTQELRKFLQRVHTYFTIPVAVGFGISTREQIELLQGYADIAVIGSALIDKMNRKEDVTEFLSRVILGRTK